MKAWPLLALLAFATPAAAVPPMPPEELKVVQAYIHALKANDPTRYGSFFSADAAISTDEAGAVARGDWIDTATTEISHPTHQVTFLRVFQSAALENGRLVERYMLVEAVKDCTPGAAECFPVYQTETLDVKGGEIVRLQRSSGYGTELSPDGERTDGG